MSVPVIGATAATSAAVAAEAARKLREEEEELTPYKSEEIEGWEFKIVRSVTGQFKKPETVQRLLEEESRAGWEMLEKFDDNRIRFKRKIENRTNDRYLEIDPYRTQFGISQGQLGLVITATIGGVILLALAGVFLFQGLLAQ
jgi:hypothetical protein